VHVQVNNFFWGDSKYNLSILRKQVLAKLDNQYGYRFMFMQLLAGKDRVSDLKVEKVDGESDLKRTRPHKREEERGVLQLLAVHGHEVDDFTG
jgi:hypothetical protein